ncbi:2-phospho-L-lactate transferase [Sphingomonas sp. 67-36]|uniref:2-phospho-L-lactate transferase n=1 Tax=Sphingomonas sp. 67-36 TaxID=1895849 RepID=UPI00092B7530|nr:2-phospho-L-lactate transferase [Sphingomonas sp. 67-36]OJV34407.1 MAG: 2-phospho-L-lactate transferase [Sphingomonas sp. 67-36]
MIVALAGGVGGARLANGLAGVLQPGELLVAVNVGDDFEHLGLTICPDIDTVTYTLAGLNDRERGWGVKEESWAFMDTLRKLGGPDWFALGDRDLAKHVLRTDRLRRGDTLTAITQDIARACGIVQTIVPVSDDPVRSIVETDEGALPFQDYFVRRRCEPVFRGIRYEGAETARPAPALLAALDDPALEAIVICPSNPVLSIGPLLAVPGIADALRRRRAPCIAVSPFIGGEAVKGPAAKIMRELGIAPGAAALAKPYAGIVDAILCDYDDPGAGTTMDGIRLIAADTLMRDDIGQRRLARVALALAAMLRKPA